MKIAVTYENGEVFQHFGHSKSFKVYEVSEGKVTSTEIIDASASGHDAMSAFLEEKGVDAVICGGLGDRSGFDPTDENPFGFDVEP